MRKNKLFKLTAILFCFFVVININKVNASECTTKELNSLKQLASNIKLSYELSDDTYNETHVYYFDIYLTNLNEKIYVKSYNGLIQKYNEGEENIFLELREGKIYSFYVYASSETNCEDKLLVTKKINVPYYNDYSQKEECLEHEEFELCQPYYGGYIESDEYFEEKLKEYKEGLKEKPKEEEKENLFEQIINFYTDNLIITIPCTLVFIGLISFMIVKIVKNKKKIKVKI